MTFALGCYWRTRVYQKQHNDPAFDLRGELYRITGVDLTDIPGINAVTAHTIISEIGTDVSRFRNASAFASWLRLCPERQISGGKVLYTKTRQSRTELRSAFEWVPIACITPTITLVSSIGACDENSEHRRQ